jgi:hypothetical protein
MEVHGVLNKFKQKVHNLKTYDFNIVYFHSS